MTTEQSFAGVEASGLPHELDRQIAELALDSLGE
jgi:hypothetical protein